MLATYLSPLADHLWQSTIFAIAAGLLAFALRKNRARTRYWIWLIASMKFFVPFSLLISLGNQLNSQTGQAVYFAPATGVLIDQVAQPFGSNQLATVPIRVPQPRPGRFSDWLPAVVFALWMCGSGMLILRWFKKWWTVRTAARQATPLSQGREFDLLADFAQTFGERKRIAIVPSTAAIEPSVFGIFNAILVWPGRLSDRLDTHEVQAILLHELSHVRHRDNLTATLHMLVQTIFWFHPLVWWLGVRLVD